jgi:glutathionyl-hydroquinone reductase
VGLYAELYQRAGVAETVDLEICKRGHYAPGALRNPLGIVPKGPAIDLAAPHGRERLGARAA